VSEEYSGADWHEQTGDTLAKTVHGIIDAFRKEQTGRRIRYLHNLSLFEGRRMAGIASADYVSEVGDAGAWYSEDRLRLIRSSVQTAVAEVYARQKPKPQFLTTGADWRTRRRAKRMDKVCEGILAQRQGRWIDVWDLIQDSGNEAALQGIAPIRVLADTEERRIVHELVPHIDLFVDPLEGREPQSLFYAQPIDVNRAIRLWASEDTEVTVVDEDEELSDDEDEDTATPRKPKKQRRRKITREEMFARRRAIRGAPEYWRFDQGRGERPRATRVIRQDVAWRLPLGPDSPGKYSVSIGGISMEESEWTAPFFPFVFLRWEDHRDGFWASGLADEGRQLAADAGELDWRLIRRSIVSSGKRTAYHAEAINEQDLTQNDEETLIKVASGTPLGEAFQESVVPALAAGEFEFAQARKSYFWEAIGISQMSASARREPGIDSAVAQRTLNDTKTGRQLAKARRFEYTFVDLAHQYVWRLSELAENDPEMIVRWPGQTLLREMSVKDALVGYDTFMVRVAPASMLSNDPAGRQQMIQEAFNAGWISADTAKSLTMWPDFEKEMSGGGAETEYIDMLIDRYLDAEADTWEAVDYEPPEGLLMNKQGALLRFLQARWQAKIDRSQVKDKSQADFCIDLLTRYIRELEAELSAMRQAEAALAAPPAAPPGGAPPPTPSALPMAQTEAMPMMPAA
jgi:hypothetical protein